MLSGNVFSPDIEDLADVQIILQQLQSITYKNNLHLHSKCFY